MENYSWVTSENRIYWTKETQNFFTSVQVLIFNIFETHHDLSFFILRNRISTTAKENPYDTAMVKLAAKKIEFNKSLKDFELAFGSSKEQIQLSGKIKESPDFQKSKLKIHPQKIKNHQEAIQALASLENQIPRGEVLHDYNRKIVAILTNSEGEIVLANSNYNYRNKVLHAEINLIAHYLELNPGPIPKDFKIYVSLKPCRMCANSLHYFCEPGVDIRFAKNDPGRLAQGSLIDSDLLQLKV